LKAAGKKLIRAAEDLIRATEDWSQAAKAAGHSEKLAMHERNRGVYEGWLAMARSGFVQADQDMLEANQDAARNEYKEIENEFAGEHNLEKKAEILKSLKAAGKKLIRAAEDLIRATEDWSQAAKAAGDSENLARHESNRGVYKQWLASAEFNLANDEYIQAQDEYYKNPADLNLKAKMDKMKKRYDEAKQAVLTITKNPAPSSLVQTRIKSVEESATMGRAAVGGGRGGEDNDEGASAVAASTPAVAASGSGTAAEVVPVVSMLAEGAALLVHRDSVTKHDSAALPSSFFSGCCGSEDADEKRPDERRAAVAAVVREKIVAEKAERDADDPVADGEEETAAEARAFLDPSGTNFTSIRNPVEWELRIVRLPSEGVDDEKQRGNKVTCERCPPDGCSQLNGRDKRKREILAKRAANGTETKLRGGHLYTHASVYGVNMDVVLHSRKEAMAEQRRGLRGGIGYEYVQVDVVNAATKKLKRTLTFPVADQVQYFPRAHVVAVQQDEDDHDDEPFVTWRSKRLILKKGEECVVDPVAALAHAKSLQGRKGPKPMTAAAAALLEGGVASETAPSSVEETGAAAGGSTSPAASAEVEDTRDHAASGASGTRDPSPRLRGR